ncbi:hypothetical protein XELAEV_18021278mg [Xenopus laevis]|uniref:Uncharacterized protein n=1 Tax=Xenopus laevis TaxID=8355 RepID=A0A974DAR9_XENLA|nr:hypothetical protein XELAEV_18021278mg [Xenopus laevis]
MKSQNETGHKVAILSLRSHDIFKKANKSSYSKKLVSWNVSDQMRGVRGGNTEDGSGILHHWYLYSAFF